MIQSLAGRGGASGALGPLCILSGWSLRKSDQKEALDPGSGDSPASRPSPGLCPERLGPSAGSPAGAEGGPVVGPGLRDGVISCRLK